MRELAGKGWRVFGYFVWMIGAGVFLDSDAGIVAGLLLLAGAGLFALGVAQTLLGADAAARRDAVPGAGTEPAARGERVEEAGS